MHRHGHHERRGHRDNEGGHDGRQEYNHGHWAAGRHRRFGKFGFGGRHGMGGGDMNPDDMRAGRMLAQGDLRLVALALIAVAPRHGYEIIKLVEEKTADWYSPSPGIVYPTLTYLEEAGYVTASTEGSKKLYTITDEGRAYLGTQGDLVKVVLDRLARDRRTRQPLAARVARRTRRPAQSAAAGRSHFRSFARGRRQADRERSGFGIPAGGSPRPHRDGIAEGVTRRSARLREGVRRVHMLGPDAHADQPRRDAAQEWKHAEDPDQEWRLRPLLTVQYLADELLLDRELHPLREAYRKGAPLLDRLKVGVRHGAGPERRRQPVGGGDRVLHRDIDADAADRRHRVRGIADADAARAATTFSAARP